MGLTAEVIVPESIQIVSRGTICSRCPNEARPGQRYCWKCHALYARYNREKIGVTDEQRRHNNARRYVNIYIERGLVKRGLCEICGSPDTQPHHEDYSKPLEVRWFCREHHLAHEGKQMHKQEIERYV